MTDFSASNNLYKTRVEVITAKLTFIGTWIQRNQREPNNSLYSRGKLRLDAICRELKIEQGLNFQQIAVNFRQKYFDENILDDYALAAFELAISILENSLVANLPTPPSQHLYHTRIEAICGILCLIESRTQNYEPVNPEYQNMKGNLKYLCEQVGIGWNPDFREIEKKFRAKYLEANHLGEETLQAFELTMRTLKKNLKEGEKFRFMAYGFGNQY